MKDDEILKPVMGDGKYASWLPFFAGMTIWEASKPICAKLEEVGSLFKLVMFDHSYMHCWRHKTPIIYRATSQWFAGMDVQPQGWRRQPARNRAGGHRTDRLLSRAGARRACTA